MAALKDYRSRGEQRMVVQHVNVADGGQAIVGNVNAPAEGVGARKKVGDQPRALGYAPGVEMPRHVEAERATVPSPSGSGVCRMHGAGGGAPIGNQNAWRQPPRPSVVYAAVFYAIVGIAAEAIGEAVTPSKSTVAVRARAVGRRSRGGRPNDAWRVVAYFSLL
jgi:hypothetical protein